uniref:Hcr9-OR2C n=1 Tax=Solanum tuberosum TaxID=4113 RepID=M1DDG9_SOLTU
MGLKSLSLGNNNFDGQLEFLSFNRWTQLVELDFSFNSLTGSITSNVSGMQNLHSLFLSSNHLNGTIPSWIFSLPSLSYLDLSDNHFSGNIGLDQEDGLHGLPLSKDCGGDEGVPQATTTYGLDQEEEEGDSTIINW